MLGHCVQMLWNQRGRESQPLAASREHHSVCNQGPVCSWVEGAGSHLFSALLLDYEMPYLYGIIGLGISSNAVVLLLGI